MKLFYEFRLKLIEFTICVHKLGLDDSERLVVNSRGEIHLSDCVWNNDKVREGPDTCHCCAARCKLKRYFLKKYGIVAPEEEQNILKQVQENRRRRMAMLPIMDYANLPL